MEFHYRFKIQFLGYRYSGWMVQPKVKTVQGMVDKTFEFLFPGVKFKTFGESRTDAKVSANEFYFYISIDTALDEAIFIDLFNSNLPNDILALNFEKVAEGYNPLGLKNIKHYIYLFSFGQKPHPFAAAILFNEPKVLDLEQMKAGAKLFEGSHNFVKYCSKPSENTQLERTITQCEIITNTFYAASFFPEKSYCLSIKSQGFLRYQVRLIMGQLFELGKGNLTLEDIKDSLIPTDEVPVRNIAASSALILQQVID